MSKKNLAVLFLLLSGVIAVLAYAGGKQSNRLSDSQINFTDKVSTKHGNKLTATIRDAVINGLTTRAQNHEKRLQAFAQNTGYPNLTPEQTSFTDLLSTNPKNNNQLTAEMRNDLLTRLTYAVTNHEMRLRKLEQPGVSLGTYSCKGTYTTMEPGSCKQDISQTSPLVGTWINMKEKCFYDLEHNEGWGNTPDGFSPQDPYAKRKCELKYDDYIRELKSQHDLPNSNKSYEHRGLRESIGKPLISCSQAGLEYSSCVLSCGRMTQNICNKTRFCKRSPGQSVIHQCSDFSETKCKATPGCSWEK